MKIFQFFSVTHNIKTKQDLIEIPHLNDNDIVYVTGEIGYEKILNGEKKVSVPHIFAKQIIRMENNNETDSLEMLEKGAINFKANFSDLMKMIHIFCI